MSYSPLPPLYKVIFSPPPLFTRSYSPLPPLYKVIFSPPPSLQGHILPPPSLQCHILPSPLFTMSYSPLPPLYKVIFSPPPSLQCHIPPLLLFNNLPRLLLQECPGFHPSLVALTQSPPSQSHAELLQA